jgi:hypothetical protein
MAFDAALPGFALQLWALIFLTIHLVSEYLSVAQASMTDSKSVHVCVCVVCMSVLVHVWIGFDLQQRAAVWHCINVCLGGFDCGCMLHIIKPRQILHERAIYLTHQWQILVGIIGFTKRHTRLLGKVLYIVLCMQQPNN